MADETNEDDSWLYGLSNADSQTGNEKETNQNIAVQAECDSSQDPQDGQIDEQLEESANADDEEKPDDDGDDSQFAADGNDFEKDDEDDAKKSDQDESDSDDDVTITIGDIKSTTNYNIKQRGNLLAQGTAAAQEKPKTTMGKFSIEEFESVGTISGQLAHEFSIDSLEEKPWRKPGADITDYFNYGFNEETWRAYCERQKKMRLHESGVGMQGLQTASTNAQVGNGNVSNRTLTSLTSTDNSKYPATGTLNINMGATKFQNRPGIGAPPGRNDTPSKENVIQVMTAERREYSRAKGKFDPMMPPPQNFPVNEPFYPEDNFSYGYEPTQEQQWNNESPGWVPSGIKELTPGPQMVPPPINMNMPPPRPMMGPPQIMNMPPMAPPPHMGMGPPPQMPIMHPPLGPMMHRDRPERNERDDRPSDYRDHDDKRGSWRPREKDRDYDRNRERADRDRGDRGKSEEADRPGRGRDDDSPSRDRDRRRSDRDRYRERERSSRRDRSRSRERSERRRRSKSREAARDKDRKSRDKKKSYKKDKDDSE